MVTSTSKTKRAISTGTKKSKNPKTKSVASEAMALRKAKSASSRHKEKKKTATTIATDESRRRRTSAEILHAQEKQDRLSHITSTLAANFNRAQRSVAADRKCFAALKKLQQESDKDEFLECFLRMLFPILLCFKREPAVERLIRFVAAFCTHSSLEQLIRQQQRKKKNGNTEMSQEEDCDDDFEDFDQDTVDFALCVVDRLIPLADVKDKATRYRVCQIVGMVINNLPDSADIDENLYQSIQETFLRRLRDKIPAVRQMAIKVLFRLQDPNDASHEITEELMRIMSTDANKDVRMEAINMLTLTKTTLSSFMERTRDVRDDVRAAVYAKIASVAALKRLTISQRVMLLKNGLKDRAKEVRETCLKMLIDQWMPQVANNLLDLLKCLDVENYTATSEMVVNLMLDRSYASVEDDGLSNTQLKKVLEVELDLSNLTPEAVLYLRCKCEFLIKRDPARLDQQLPTASEFCELIIAYHKEDCEFITKQLLVIARYLDYADEIGRQKMHALLANMLVTFTHPEVYPPEIIAAVKVIIAGNADDFISTLVEKVDELRKAAAVCQREGVDESKETLDLHKEEVQRRIKALTRKVNTLKRQERQHAEDEDYEGAANTKKERRICELEIDDLMEEYTQLERTSGDGTSAEIMLWVRALCIVGEFLNQSSANVDITHLLYLVHDLVLVTLDHDSEYVRQHAYRVLGQFCCFKIDLAKQYAGYFLRCLADEHQDLEVQTTALRAVFDFIQLHGLAQLFEETNVDGERQETEGDVLVTALKSFFTNEHTELRTIVVEGFAKLIMCNKLQEKHLPDVLSRLIMMQFDPATERDERIRQCLPVFLPSYSFSFVSNIRIMSRLVIPTLRRVANSTTSTSSTDLAQLGQYLMYLSDPENLHQSQKETVDIQSLLSHEQIAIDLALEVLADPTSKASNIFCRLFNNMTIYSVNNDQIKVLRHLIRKVIGAISNKVTMKTLNRFDTMLVALIGSSDDEDMNLTEEMQNTIAEKAERFKCERETFIELMNEDELNFDIASAGYVGIADNEQQQQQQVEDEQMETSDIFASPRSTARVSVSRTPDRRRSTRSIALNEQQRLQLEEEEEEEEGESGQKDEDDNDATVPTSSDDSDEMAEDNIRKRRKKTGRRASDEYSKELKKMRHARVPRQGLGETEIVGILDFDAASPEYDDYNEDDDLEGDIDALEGLLDDDDDENERSLYSVSTSRSRRTDMLRHSMLDREIEDMVEGLDFSDDDDL